MDKNNNLLMTLVFQKTKKVIESAATAEIMKLTRTTGQRFPKYISIFHEFTN